MKGVAHKAPNLFLTNGMDCGDTRACDFGDLYSQWIFTATKSGGELASR